jgi:hypothetical protein
LDARLTTLLCKKYILVKSKEVKTGCNLAESCNEGYGSKGAVLPVMMIMMNIVSGPNGGTIKVATPSSESNIRPRCSANVSLSAVVHI